MITVIPPVYDGRTPLDKWVCRFEACASSNSWDATAKASAVQAFLEGEALVVYLELEKKKRTFDDVRTALEAAFSPKECRGEFAMPNEQPNRPPQEIEPSIPNDGEGELENGRRPVKKKFAVEDPPWPTGRSVPACGHPVETTKIGLQSDSIVPTDYDSECTVTKNDATVLFSLKPYESEQTSTAAVASYTDHDKDAESSTSGQASACSAGNDAEEVATATASPSSESMENDERQGLTSDVVLQTERCVKSESSKKTMKFKYASNHDTMPTHTELSPAGRSLPTGGRVSASEATTFPVDVAASRLSETASMPPRSDRKHPEPDGLSGSSASVHSSRAAPDVKMQQEPLPSERPPASLHDIIPAGLLDVPDEAIGSGEPLPGVSTAKPKHPEHAVEARRLQSFSSWPLRVLHSPENLAKAGFYYAGFGDNVKCFYCDGGLRNCEIMDNPWEEHARWYKECKYLRDVKGEAYVDEIQKKYAVVNEAAMLVVTSAAATSRTSPGSSLEHQSVQLVKILDYSESQILAAPDRYFTLHQTGAMPRGAKHLDFVLQMEDEASGEQEVQPYFKSRCSGIYDHNLTDIESAADCSFNNSSRPGDARDHPCFSDGILDICSPIKQAPYDDDDAGYSIKDTAMYIANSGDVKSAMKRCLSLHRFLDFSVVPAPLLIQVYAHHSSDSVSEQDRVRNLMALPPEEPEALMKIEAERLRTYESGFWPIRDVMPPEELAAAGFYYTGVHDRVQCAFCRGVLRNWERGDSAMNEHRVHFSYCRLVMGLECGNVPIASGRSNGEIAFTFPTRGGQTNLFALTDRPLNDVPDNTSFANLLAHGNEFLATMGSGEPLPGVSTAKPKHPEHAVEARRLQSFSSWPLWAHQSPENLAKAGFYYAGFGDNVKCFYCDGGLRNWEIMDNPWEEHARWFKECKYLLDVKGQAYVDEIQKKYAFGNEADRLLVTSAAATSRSSPGSSPEYRSVQLLKSLGYSEDQILAALERFYRQHVTGAMPKAAELINAVHGMEDEASGARPALRSAGRSLPTGESATATASVPPRYDRRRPEPDGTGGPNAPAHSSRAAPDVPRQSEPPPSERSRVSLHDLLFAGSLHVPDGALHRENGVVRATEHSASGCGQDPRRTIETTEVGQSNAAQQVDDTHEVWLRDCRSPAPSTLLEVQPVPHWHVHGQPLDDEPNYEFPLRDYGRSLPETISETWPVSHLQVYGQPLDDDLQSIEHTSLPDTLPERQGEQPDDSDDL